MRSYQALRTSRDQPNRKGPTVITKPNRKVGALDYDVCICGGTLGVFIGLALQVCEISGMCHVQDRWPR